MESAAERKSIYQELLTESFEHLAKQLPKTSKAAVQQLLEQLKEDQELNANKYFGIYKLAINSKDPKAISMALDAIDKLVNTGFLDGNCEESSIDLDLEKPKEGDKTPKDARESRRKLIDTIVEVVCSCKRERSDDIQKQLINVLTIIATKLKNIVHGNNLQRILETLSHVYTVSRNQENQATAKSSLKLIVNTVFQRVDKLDQPGEHSSKHRKGDFEVSFTEGPSKILSNRMSPDTTSHINNASDKAYEETLAKETAQEETKREETAQDTTPKVTKEGDETTKNASQKDTLYQSYVSRYVTNIVDDVCMFYAKVDQVSKKYEGKEEAEKENLQQELNEIPIKAIPLTSDIEDPRYKILRKVKIENEAGTPAGVFGWCFICRSAASLFCKDTKVPVCSLDCKFKHLEEADFLNNAKNKDFGSKNLEEVQDAYQVFGYLCRLSSKEQGKENVQEIIRLKALALELLLAAMANPSAIFSTRKEFRDSIKEYLCTSVLKNSVSADKTIFSYSLGLFNSLINHFRDFLKAEMALFIDTIFFNMLESGNSNYQQRMSALQVFYKICSKSNIILDFYVNYDCDTDSNNIVERMVELLCKIAQGKFARPEYSTVIQPAQDQNLRFIALGALVNLVKALVIFTEDHNKHIQSQNALKKITPADGMKEEDDRDMTIDMSEFSRADFSQLDEIGKTRHLKNELQKAVHKFNFKIKLGMKLFTQLGVLKPDDAKSVARFFKKTPNLSHEKLGEYFGDEHDFNIKVLTEFTELIDFRGKNLDDGLRHYLKHFQLPGEGQKIDRVMQAFAGKYYKDNPTSFSSSTTAYTLSFLFMMLQTDSHNPQVKPEDKMKLESFINLARGMDDGKNLPPEELTGYYNRIIQTPLGFHASDRTKRTIPDSQNVSLKMKEQQFKMESDKMIKEGQRLIKGAHQSKQYHTVRNTECIKPLFHEVVWSPVLAVFSVLLEQSEDTNMIQSCLDGFANCIILTGLHNMSVERDTFVSSLAKFTNILTIREIKEKNIKCIKLLLDLATNRGNLLRSSWRYVLECIVWIDYYFHYSPQHSRASDIISSKTGKNQHNDILEQTEQANSEIVQQIVDLNVVNIIFSKSATFDIEEITDFITCLCQISDEELRGKGANTFCLQKLVEVAHFNMDGIKFIWSRIWSIMREHISTVALTSKPEVSLFAIDLLKQLSIKFLGQKELGLLEFQKDFLKPFETIFQKTKNDDMKELILSCCNYIISHTKRDLKSGWKSIIDILGLAADSEDSHLSKLAFQITESMLQDDIKLLHDSVSDFTILLLKFARSKKQDVAEVSIKHLKSFLHQSIVIETGDATPTKDAEHDLDAVDTTVVEEPIEYKNITIHGLPENTWISILTSIITLASDSSARIQSQSTMLLFDLIEQYGSGFPPSFWNMVLSGVIKPLFDEIQYSLPSGNSARNAEKAGAFREFYEKSFERFIDIFSIYFNRLSQFNVELFNIIFNGIQNQSQIISKVAANALKYMIFKDQNLRLKGLDIVNELLTRLCSNTSLTHLLNTKLTGNDEEDDKEITDLNIKKEGVIEYKDWKLYPLDCDVQCRTQLLLVEIIKDVTDKFFVEFDEQQITKLKNIVKTIWKLSRKFNEQTYLRYCLSNRGFMRDRIDKSEIADLLELEKDSLSVYSHILYNLYTDKNSKDHENALQEFIDMGLEITKDFKHRNEKLLALSKTDLRKIGSIEGQPEVEEQPIAEETITDDEYKKQASRIKKTSLEKEILSLRGALYTEFLTKQEKLDIEQIKGRLQEVTKSIIDGVICFIPKENEEYADVLRKIMTRYFDYTHDKSDE